MTYRSAMTAACLAAVLLIHQIKAPAAVKIKEFYYMKMNVEAAYLADPKCLFASEPQPTTPKIRLNLNCHTKCGDLGENCKGFTQKDGICSFYNYSIVTSPSTETPSTTALYVNVPDHFLKPELPQVNVAHGKSIKAFTFENYIGKRSLVSGVICPTNAVESCWCSQSGYGRNPPPPENYNDIIVDLGREYAVKTLLITTHHFYFDNNFHNLTIHVGNNGNRSDLQVGVVSQYAEYSSLARVQYPLSGIGRYVSLFNNRLNSICLCLLEIYAIP